MAESRDNEKKAGHPHGGRNRWLYIGSVVILVLVVVTFVGAPVVSSAAGSGRLVFGRYGREDIVYQPGNFFARQYEAIAQSLRDSGNDADLELQLRIAGEKRSIGRSCTPPRFSTPRRRGSTFRSSASTSSSLRTRDSGSTDASIRTRSSGLAVRNAFPCGSFTGKAQSLTRWSVMSSPAQRYPARSASLSRR
jgi:hypothetical protein